MALDDIKKEILTEAQKEAEIIEAEGHKKVANLKLDWNKKLEARKLEIMNEVKQKTNQKVQQAQFKLQAQLQNDVINQKQKLIDKAYKQALIKLTNLSDDAYIDLMVNLIETLPKGEGELISTKDKEGLLKKAVKKTNQKIEIASETISGQGGFIFKSKEIDIDYTFSALINGTKEETLLEVAKKMFNDNQN